MRIYESYIFVILPIHTKPYSAHKHKEILSFQGSKYIFKTCDSSDNTLQSSSKIKPTYKNSLRKNSLKFLCFAQKLLCMPGMNLFDFRIQRI